MSQTQAESVNVSTYEREPGGQCDNELELRPYTHASGSLSRQPSGPVASPPSGPFHLVKKFWRDHVSVTVSHDSCRDHFGESQV
jgi:hypothetical protein